MMQETGDEKLTCGVIFAASIIHGGQPTLDLGPSSGSGGLTALCLVTEDYSWPGEWPSRSLDCMVSLTRLCMEKKHQHRDNSA